MDKFIIKRPRLDTTSALFIATPSESEGSGSDLNKDPVVEDTEPNAIHFDDTTKHGYPMDIGAAVGRNLNDKEKLDFFTKTWIPTKGYQFKAVIQGGKARRFQIKWLAEFPWLSYSHLKEGAFCKVCVLFGRTEGGRGQQKLVTLVTLPLCKYKDALEECRSHSSRDYHKTALLHASGFKSVMEGNVESVDVQLNKSVRETISQNRKRLLPIIGSLLFCGRQNLSTRGRRDTGTIDATSLGPENEGNFRELLKFRVRAGDTDLGKHLENSPRNAMFISNTVQNEIIDCCASIIQSKIAEQVNESKYFSVLADETTDCARREQLSLCVRYYHNDKIKEDFLTFVEVTDLSGAGLAQTILTTLKKLNLNVENFRGQGFDGAANMAGQFRGVQAEIRKEHKLAAYTHCASQSLNLNLCKACSVPGIRNLLGVVSEVCSFFKSSSQRTKLLENKVEEISITCDRRRLKPFCDTRWVEKHDSLMIFDQMYRVLGISLHELTESVRGETSGKANVLASVLHKFDTIICLKVAVSIFALTLHLAKDLQKVDIDLFQCCEMVDIVLNVLKEKRNGEDNFHKIFSEAHKLAESLDVPVILPRMVSRQSNRSNVPADTPEKYYRRCIYKPFVDFMIQQLNDRFVQHRNTLMRAQFLLPSEVTKTDWEFEKIRSFLQEYEDDLTSGTAEINAEVDMWRHYWMSKSFKPSNPSTTLFALSKESTVVRSAFENIIRLIHIFCIIPVTTATAERSFSTLIRLKTWLRNRMSEDRLVGLALLNIHREISLTCDEILNCFARQHPRRLQFLNVISE